MLSFFRRLINSRLGIVVALGLLGVIVIAFAAGDVSGLRSGAMGGLLGNDVVKVGGGAITASELRQRVGNELDGARQQQPTLTMTDYVARGGFDATLERAITGLSFERFGHQQGMLVGKRAVDGALASIPGLQAPNGTFDMATYRRLLAERHLTDSYVRGDIARQTLIDQLTAPTVGAGQVPTNLALPYASLLLEQRSGEIAFVPTAAMKTGAAPTDADVQAFYKRGIARYSLPERRIVRYALVSPDSVKAQATPTDAEIAAAYKADAAKYQPMQRRTVSSVVAIDQAAAAAIAAKVKAGTPLADAARAAGLEASTQPVTDKAAYASATSPAIAAAVFAAPKGALIGPLKASLGYLVARIDAVEQVPGKTLEQARPDIVAALTKRKTLQAMSDIHDGIDDALGKNATFDEVVGNRKLTAATTPALLANGVDPTKPEAKPESALVPILAAGFQASEGDTPQLVQTGADGSFALVALGRIVPAAARPLADVREQVTRDLVADRARTAAKTLANTIVAKVSRGTALPAAVAAAGQPLPGVKPIAISRAQLAAAQGRAPAALVLMFSMKPGSAKLLEAPNNSGWLIVKLDTVKSADARRVPAVVTAARTDLARLVGREYVDQFARAIRADLGVKVDQAAVSRLKADLVSGGAANN